MLLLTLFAFAGGGAVLLTGCDASQFSESEEKNSENDETSDTIEETEPSDEEDEETTGNPTYYYGFGGAKNIPETDPDDYYSTGGGTSYLSYPNSTAVGTARLRLNSSTGTILASNSNSYTSGLFYYRFTRTTSSFTAYLQASPASGYHFIGWYEYWWDDNGSDGGESSITRVTSSQNTTVTMYGSTSSGLGSGGSFYLAYFCSESLFTTNLTINYVSRTSCSTYPNLKISVTNGTTSATSISRGGSATVTRSGSVSSATVKFSLSNTTNAYYMRIGGVPTTSNYTHIFTSSAKTDTYTFSSSSDTTINIYIYQRYTISYNVNGGSGTRPSTQYKIYGKSITLATNNLTKDAYSPNGWNTNSSGTGTPYPGGTTYSTNANRTLYACWSPITYTLTLNPNGGTVLGSSVAVYRSYNIEADSSISSAPYDEITSLPTPTKKGYIFNGWRAGSSTGSWTSGTDYSAGLSLSGRYGSVTLTAQWTADTYTWSLYVMTQTSGGGSYGFSTARTGVSVTVSYTNSSGNSASSNVSTSLIEVGIQDHTLSFRASSSNANYKFIGFTTSNSAPTPTENPSASISVTPTGNVTRYAWFMYVSTNEILSDSGGFYYEDGEYPQTRVTNQTTINALNRLTSATYSISYLNANGTNSTISVYAYSGARYGRATNPSGTVGWFTVEPIKWRVENGWTFTGSNFFTLGREYMYTDRMTMSVWAYSTNWSTYGSSSTRIISCTESGGWNIEATSTSNGNIRFAIYDSGTGYKNIATSIAWSSLSSGWHMFTLTFDGTNARGYLDGQLVGTSSAFSSGRIGYNANNTIFVGAEAGANATTPAGSYFVGQIAGLYIENSCWSASTIQDRFESRDITNSLSGWSTYGTYNSNFVAVSERVLGFGAIEETHMEEGGSYRNSNMYTNNLNASNSQRTSGYLDYAANTSISFESFVSGANLDIVTSTSVTYQGLRAASVEEIEKVYGGMNSNWRAQCSDMVAFMLGVSEDSYVDYWTRDLGTMLDNGTIITAESGEESNAWVHEVHGVRFSITCSQGSSV